MADQVGATQAFQAQAEAVIEDLLRLQPERASSLGDHRYDDRLDDLGESGRAELRAAAVRGRDGLDSLDLDALEPPDAVDADVLRTALDATLLAVDVLDEPRWNPLVWLPGEAIYSLVARDVLPAADRLSSLAARLGAVPERLALATRTLEDMPRVHVETAMGQAAGAATLIRDEVDRLLAAEPSMASTVEPAQRAALRAVETYRAWLEDRLPTAGRDPRLGPEVFAAKLHLGLDADLSAEQVVTRARDNLARVTAELAAVSRDWTGQGGDDSEVIRFALDRVARDVCDDNTIVELARRTLVETTRTVAQEGLVTDPGDPCEIQVMPEFRRGVAVAYCDAPGALEDGGMTYYAISPTPADWSQDRVASFYREYNVAMLTNLTIHEAMPGHVLQLAHNRRYAGRTRVRKVFRSGSFVEGWAVHAERLMAEAGHGGVPVRLQQLKMQLRMTINALLDAGVHAGGMSQAEAMELMTGTGFQEEGEAVGKWRRALLTSAQLSTYFVGYAELDDVLRATGPRTAATGRYDDVLAHGSPPPRHLRSLLAAATG
ncbi:MAG: DUF885 domain-containing protein [Actinomycetota bacterium]|nr:DUF885 domain-containing protein [Actinomycetota bacterium]